MAVEKRNPLPVGRYTVDVSDMHSSEFTSWLTEHKDTVFVEQSEERDGLTWYLFKVFEPVPWQGPGYPDSIGDQILQDDKSPPLEPLPDPGKVIDEAEEKFKKAAEEAADAVKTGLTVAAAAGGVYVLWRLLS